MPFSVDYPQILAQIDAINPILYGQNRNYLHGNVTKLSPYISRGVISTKQMYDSIVKRGFNLSEIEPFIKELAWRDYFQRVLEQKPNLHQVEIKNQQQNIAHYGMIDTISHAKTGINAIDQGINDLYQTGYMHNHVRMYVASIVCNIGQSHWKTPSKWMYYHLLDADMASNACSWQWVCGAFSSKKYYANQENINKYCKTNQQNTFLDVSYEQFENLAIPDVLMDYSDLNLKTKLPAKTDFTIDETKPTLIYNYYNLDPIWHKNENYNRVLLIEPSHFDQFPISDKSMNFMLSLANNIFDIQIFVGEFEDLKMSFNVTKFISKKHPLFEYYESEKEERDWIFPDIKGYFPSFFNYWNSCAKKSSQIIT